MNIVDVMDKIFGNWYVILGAVVVAFGAAILDQWVDIPWMFGLGIKAAFVVLICGIYAVIRAIINSIVSYFKKRK